MTLWVCNRCTLAHNADFCLCRYIIRSDPLAHMPEDSQVGQARSRNQQDFGTETRDETHLWNPPESSTPWPLLTSKGQSGPTEMTAPFGLRLAIHSECALSVSQPQTRNNQHLRNTPLRDLLSPYRAATGGCMKSASSSPAIQTRIALATQSETEKRAVTTAPSSQFMDWESRKNHI